MKLVEIDDTNLSPCTNNGTHIDDDSYTKPCVMSTLDNAMNEILRAPISDGDKWKLYSQALRRYLSHSKFTSRKFDDNVSYPITVNESRNKDTSAENLFNLSLGDISLPNQLDISGVERIRDSIDSISHPNVKNFFEKAREANIISNTSLSSSNAEAEVPPKQRRKKKPSNPISVRRRLPQRNNGAAMKRRAEMSLSADLSQIRPCKVAIQRLNWVPTTAR